MRLSTVLELLLIALLVAFAASRVIDPPAARVDPARSLGSRATRLRQRQDAGSVSPSNTPSRYCTCSSLTCKCCRDFSLPVVPVKGPGCATVSYLHDDAMMITMSFGERVLRNITVNSKKPKPICMGMPGGISKFCGRLYSIKREGENFKACLGLELRALDDVEAALRVSCFKFGPGGVNVEPGEAVPAEKIKEEEDEDDDDDDFGLGALDDDDDDDYDGLTGGEDEDERPPAKDSNHYADSSDSSDVDADYTGLSSLSEELFGGIFGSGKKRKPILSYDEDSSEEDDYEPEPPKSQAAQYQAQPQAPTQPPTPQVNLVVMQPVFIPTPEATTKRPLKVRKRPTKQPVRVTSTQPTPAKRVRPTTPATVKKVRTTTVLPLSTLTTSTAIPSEAPSSTTTKKPKKKKKKPSRRRRPTSPKPVTVNSTEEALTAIVQTSTSVSVVQGDVVLNENAIEKNTSVKESPLNIPMGDPVLETNPVDVKHQSDEIVVLNSTKTDAVTDKVQTDKTHTEAHEVTTQAIMQNTIPTDEAFDDGLHPISIQKVVVKRPAGDQIDEIAGENLMPVGTALSPGGVEYTTVQGTTLQEMAEYTADYQNVLRDSENSSTSTHVETTDNYYEFKGEGMDRTENKGDENNGGFYTTLADKEMFTESLSSATEAYYSMDEATDKTEAITENVHKKENRESASDESSDKEDEDDDDDLGGLDISADLGLDDDDDEDEKSSEKEPAPNGKPEDKDDEDDDILDGLDGGILDDEEDDEDDSKTKGDTEDRSFKHETPFKINPMLYRLARVSSGFTATSRHLPRSDGRNRRNNKRMRFPSLELTT